MSSWTPDPYQISIAHLSDTPGCGSMFVILELAIARRESTQASFKITQSTPALRP